MMRLSEGYWEPVQDQPFMFAISSGCGALESLVLATGVAYRPGRLVQK
jgi:hypothetical protein